MYITVYIASTAAFTTATSTTAASLTASTTAINVTKVTVDISPSDNDIIPVVLDLQDDSIAEPTEFYQLVIVNISDPNVVVGEINMTFIIVNDDDIGKIWHACVNLELYT